MQQYLTLTCPICKGQSPRPLPYDMVKPDKCDHCPHKFQTRFRVALIEAKLFRQSRLGSFVEAVVNTGVGLLIAFVAQMLIVWANDIPLTWEDNAIIVWWMTVISVIRTYVIRRAWNSEFWKGSKRG